MDGWVKLHRKLIDSIVFANERALKIWIWILIKARHEKGFVNIKIGKGESIIELNRGELLFGRLSAENSLNINASTIYKWIQKFKDWKMIELKSNNHYTIITVCKYDTYNHDNTNKVTTIKQPLNSQRTTIEQPLNTNKNDKNENNKKIYSQEIESLYLKLKPLFPDLINTNYDKWKDTLRLLIDNDKKQSDEIEKVVKWARNDQFWSKQFLSLVKLRNKNKDGIMYYDVFNEQSKNVVIRPTKLA